MKNLDVTRVKLATAYEENYPYSHEGFSDGFDAGAKAVMEQAQKLAAALEVAERSYCFRCKALREFKDWIKK